jgi:hypothetical protein
LLLVAGRGRAALCLPLKTVQRFLRRYWGLAVVAFLVIAWTTAQLGPGVLALLSGLVLFWAAFQARAWCGPANRRSGEFCRPNSRGLLLGCHLRESHQTSRPRRCPRARRCHHRARLTQHRGSPEEIDNFYATTEALAPEVTPGAGASRGERCLDHGNRAAVGEE